jgi:TRAP-type C4-dicarboxylate transport system permease small subunit
MNPNRATEKSEGIYSLIDKGFSTLAKMVAMAAGFIILFMAFLLLKELVMRNLGKPGSWTGEVVEIMVMWSFLLPLAYSQMDGAMIRVTVITSRFSPKNQVWLMILSSVSSVVFGVLLFIASYGFFSKTVPGSYFPETGFPTIIQRAGVPACSLLLALSGIACTVKAIKGLKFPERFIAEMNGGE